MTYKCAHCKDAGFTSGTISYQQYGSSDKYFCRECEKGEKMLIAWMKEPAQQLHLRQWKQEKIDRMMRISGVDGCFRDKRLKDIKDGSNLFQECQKYVDGWEQMKTQGFGFYFWGNVGAGKTHTAAAIANELMEKKQVEVLFLSMPEAVTRVKKTFDTELKGEDARLFDRMKEVELLILDDLGVEKNSEWLTDQMYQIIDHRWKNKKPLIVTTNLSIEDLGMIYKPQVASRLCGCCKPIKFTNKDRRKNAPALF
jgi:DNA replication protein DnaC